MNYTNKNIILLCIVSLLLVVAPVLGTGALTDTTFESSPQDDSGPTPAEIDPELRSANGPTTVILRLPELPDRDASQEAMRAHANKTQEPVVERFEELESVTVEGRFWITNAVVATIDVDKIALGALAEIEGIERLHANVELEIQSVANGAAGPARPVEPGATAEDTTWNVERVNAPEAWSTHGTKGAGVKAAVLDTGIEVEHDDLELFTTDPADPTYPGGWAEIDSSGNVVTDPDPPYDAHGHGTRVSGVVAGGNANGEYNGVAPEVDLMHGKIAGEDGYASFSSMTGGLEWAVANGAEVVSISFGAEGYYSYLVDPIRNAESTGTVVVAAIGNEGEGTSTTPGNEYDSFGIGATDYYDDVSSFSSGETIDTEADWGSDAPSDWPDQYVVPDVVAPGEQILTTYPGNDYGGASGTSLAAPHVTGAIALAIAATDATHSPDAIKTGFEESARHPDGDAAHDTRYGHGIIDVLAAIDSLQSQSDGSPSFGVTSAGLNETSILESESVSVTATVENVGDADGTFTANLSENGSVVDSKNVDIASGGAETVQFERSYDTAGTYDLAVNETAAGTLTVEQPATFEIQSAGLDNSTITTGETATATAEISNGGDRTGSYTAGLVVAGTGVVNSSSIEIPAGETATVSLAHTPKDAGTYELSVNETLAGDLVVQEPALFDVGATVPGEERETNESVWIDVTVTNIGGQTGAYTVEFQVGAETAETRDVELAPDESRTLTFERSFEEAGEYTVTVDGVDRGTLSVVEASTLLERRWSYENGVRIQHATPAVSNSLVFVGGLGESLTALYRENGSIAWEFSRAGSLSDSSPTVHDGTVYVGSGGGVLYALDAGTGRIEWTHQTGSALVSSPTVADGAVYVGTNDGRLLKLDANRGRLAWTSAVDSAVYSRPTVDSGGQVYVTTAGGSLVAIDTTSGDQQWAFDTGTELGKASPTVANGTVYVAGNEVYALDATSTQSVQWRQSIDGTSASTPTIDNGTVYVGSNGDAVYALDAADGSGIWTRETDGAVVSQPAMAGGRVVVGTLNGTVLLLDTATGDVDKAKSFDGAFYASPVVVENGVYLGLHNSRYVTLANVAG